MRMQRIGPNESFPAPPEFPRTGTAGNCGESRSVSNSSPSGKRRNRSHRAPTARPIAKVADTREWTGSKMHPSPADIARSRRQGSTQNQYRLPISPLSVCILTTILNVEKAAKIELSTYKRCQPRSACAVTLVPKRYVAWVRRLFLNLE